MGSTGASVRIAGILIGLAAIALLLAPAGADASPTCGGLPPTIIGTPANNVLTGTEGDDVVRAGSGNDTINTLGGNDVVCAGPGDDTTDSGDGNDRLRSGSGNDNTSAGSGDDDLRGQGGTDTGNGGPGIDACFFETYTECEADLRLDLTGPAAATHGSQTVYSYVANLRNAGPSPAGNARIDVTIPTTPPTNATFVPEESDPRCASTSASNIRCAIGRMGVDTTDTATIGLRFTTCFGPPPPFDGGGLVSDAPVIIDGDANDPITNDQDGSNNGDSVTTTQIIDNSCFQNN